MSLPKPPGIAAPTVITPSPSSPSLEIVKGFHKLQREDRVQQFLDGLPGVELLTLDQRSAALAGRIYADLERVGQPIGRADPMIAAIALARPDVGHWQPLSLPTDPSPGLRYQSGQLASKPRDRLLLDRSLRRRAGRDRAACDAR